MQNVKDKRNVLVIVGREAEPSVLVDALRPRATGTGFTVLVPAIAATGARITRPTGPTRCCAPSVGRRRSVGPGSR